PLVLELVSLLSFDKMRHEIGENLERSPQKSLPKLAQQARNQFKDGPVRFYIGSPFHSRCCYNDLEDFQATTLEDARRCLWRNVGELQASRQRPTVQKSSRSSYY
ncbi:hypothetical protein L9F63_027306, partial [Diploptera punctata]